MYYANNRDKNRNLYTTTQPFLIKPMKNVFQILIKIRNLISMNFIFCKGVLEFEEDNKLNKLKTEIE